MMNQVHSSAPRSGGPAGGTNADAAPTDKELLELAAKAAGLPHKWSPLLNTMLHVIDAGRCETWNPIKHDGDALRLAVKCHIDLLIFASHVTATSVAWDGTEHFPRTAEFEDGMDVYAATRRAIVDAAAEMGRVMSAA